MTHGEALALLDGRRPAASRGAALDALMATSEGWPAALSLAAQTLAGAADPDRGAARFGGDDPFVADYVRRRAAGRPAPEQLAFLRRCSVLDVLEADLCDAVVGGHGRGGAAARARALRAADHPRRPRRRAAALPSAAARGPARRAAPRTSRRAERRCTAAPARWFAAHDDLDAAIAPRAGRRRPRPRRRAAVAASRRATRGTAAARSLDRWLRALPAHAVERHRGARR